MSLITGGASGLGKATAKRFIEQGGKVVICDLPKSDGANVAKEFGNDCLFVPTDVSNLYDFEICLFFLCYCCSCFFFSPLW